MLCIKLQFLLSLLLLFFFPFFLCVCPELGCKMMKNAKNLAYFLQPGNAFGIVAGVLSTLCKCTALQEIKAFFLLLSMHRARGLMVAKYGHYFINT